LAFRICVGHGFHSLSHWRALLKKTGAEDDQTADS
jgi:hypothetical protein